MDFFKIEFLFYLTEREKMSKRGKTLEEKNEFIVHLNYDLRRVKILARRTDFLRVLAISTLQTKLCKISLHMGKRI
jgi:hypothetical protein